MNKPARALAAETSIRRVEAVINPASGGVGPQSAAALKQILDDFGLESRVLSPSAGEIEYALQAAVQAAPDLLIVLAGDGTAGRAAELCGPDGPLLAPLPGGTMNMLPYALYGPKPWPEVLADCLWRGVERPVSCGEVGGHRFYCVAILGSPALWQPVREATRHSDLAAAWDKALIALRQAFSTRLRFQVAGEAPQKAIALSLICPLISRALATENSLEAAGLHHRDLMELFRLGFHNLLGDWRADPGVITEPCIEGRVWARRRIPCLIDGEMRWLARSANIRFHPTAFRALAPPPEIKP